MLKKELQNIVVIPVLQEHMVRKRNELDIEINFEDFVKRQLNQQTILLNQLQKTMEKILSFQKINS